MPDGPCLDNSGQAPRHRPIQPDPQPSLPVGKRRVGRRFLLLGAALVGILIVGRFREPLLALLTQRAVLANDAPPPELVEEMLRRAPDPVAAVISAWDSGKIVHREVAVRHLGHMVGRDQPLPGTLESILLAGALDVDTDVREAALSILRYRQDPALAALATAQLTDVDPEIRRAGLNSLQPLDAKIGVPSVIPELDEPDPALVALALKLLEKWSGENFGVKLSDTAPVYDQRSGVAVPRVGSLEKARAGAARAKAWWAKHKAGFPPVHLALPRAALAARQRVPAGNFALRDLEGRWVRLADFRGRVVLLNFWTTWCPACVSEMPELIELQKQHADHLAIIGVSLDALPDEHGDVGGQSAVEGQDRSNSEPDSVRSAPSGLNRVRDLVARTVRARGINYRVLLDETDEVGGRFNGGELPTTVIIDPQGEVRRRFVGARSLPVLEAMIAEASHPPKDGARVLEF